MKSAPVPAFQKSPTGFQIEYLPKSQVFFGRMLPNR